MRLVEFDLCAFSSCSFLMGALIAPMVFQTKASGCCPTPPSLFGFSGIREQIVSVSLSAPRAFFE